MKKFIDEFLQKVKTDIDFVLLALLVFSLPFDRIPSIDIVGVTLRFSIVFGGLVILRALYLIIRKRRPWRWNWSNKLLLIFLVWVVLLIPEAINIKHALQVSFFTMYVGFVAMAVGVLYKREHLKLLLQTLIFSASITVLIGFWQYFGDIVGVPNKFTGLAPRYSYILFGFPRVQSTGLEPLYYGSYLLIPIAVMLSAYLFAAKKKAEQIMSNRWLLGLLFAFTLALFLTVSRGALYALVAMAVVFALYGIIRAKVAWRKISIIAVLLLLSFGFSYFLVSFINKSPGDILKTFNKKGGQAYTGQLTKTGLEGLGDERTQARNKAITILKTNKAAIMLGIGPGQYGPYVTNNKIESYGWPIVNNETLELWVEYGIIGLLLLCMFIVTLFVRGVRRVGKVPQNLTEVTVVGLLTYLIAEMVQYQTFSTLYVMQIWVAIGLIMALISIKVKTHK